MAGKEAVGEEDAADPAPAHEDFSVLTGGFRPPLVVLMQRQVLKSQIDRAHVTEVALDGEEGIEIPAELLEEAGLCEGERVLVVSRTTGTRLETPVRVGNATTGRIILSGAAAHRIGRGERVSILAFGISHEPVLAQKLVLNERNENPHRWH